MQKTKKQKKKQTNGSKQLAPASLAKSLAAKLEKVGGSPVEEWNRVLLSQALGTVTLDASQADKVALHQAAVMSAMMEFQPANHIEGMFAAQLVGLHNMTMECMKCAAIRDQPIESRREYFNQVEKLSRAFAALLDNLRRHRGGSQQKISVEHLHLHAPTQAPASSAGTSGGGGAPQIEEQPHARQIIDASISPVRRENAKREKVSVAGDAQRPLPNARGSLNRRTKGK